MANLEKITDSFEYTFFAKKVLKLSQVILSIIMVKRKLNLITQH